MTNIGYSDYFPNSQFQMHCLACLGKILPNENYCLMTIFWPCPDVVIISDNQCMLFGRTHRNTYSLTELAYLAGRQQPLSTANLLDRLVL